MPIYAYRCAACGFEKDVLQKMSDAKLTICPECKAETFVKQLTAAGFQLKGSGWYATDFKTQPAKEGKSTDSTNTATTASDSAATDAKTTTPVPPSTVSSDKASSPASTTN